MATYTLTDNDATAILGDFDAILSRHRDAVAAMLPLVMAELPRLAAIRDADRDRHAFACIVTAALSPRTKFPAQTAYTHATMTLFDAIAAAAEWRIAATLRATNARLYGRYSDANLVHVKAAALTIIAAHRGDITAANMSVVAIMAACKAGIIAGVSIKCANFAAHLYDANARAWTLDTWMLRGMMMAIGHDGNATFTHRNNAQYNALADASIEWAGRHFPNVPLFAVQWALWNVYRGYHESHAVLFA